MPAYELEPQVVLTTPLLEGLDGVEKMSKSLGNYVGVTEAGDAMYAKLMSISDELMWKYYTLLTDFTPPQIEAEKAKAQPMASKMALARRIVTDFHDARAADSAESEWRRIHQQGQAPSEMETRELLGAFKPHQLLFQAGLCASSSEGMRLVRQGAMKLDGVAIDPASTITIGPDASHVLSVGSKRHVRIVGQQRS